MDTRALSRSVGFLAKALIRGVFFISLFVAAGAIPALGAEFNVHRYLNQPAPGVLSGDNIYVSDYGSRYTAHGEVTVFSNGGFVYYPQSGYVGTDAFSYTECDRFNVCTPGTATLNVTNEPPSAGGDTFTVHNYTTQGAPGVLATTLTRRTTQSV